MEAEYRLGEERRRPWTECEDCDILAFGSDFADDCAKALDKMGWMIIRQPRHSDAQRWNMNLPRANCPAWANNGLFFFRGIEVGNGAAS